MGDLNMCGYIVVVVLVCGGVLGDTGHTCGERELRSMKEEFSNCTRRFQQEYNVQATSSPGVSVAATCHLVDSLVGVCGTLWSYCHTHQEVERRKDIHTEAILSQNKDTGVDVEQCSVVQEYRRRHQVSHEVGCDERLVMESRRKFQVCSHNTTTAVYSVVGANTDTTTLTLTFCRALDRMANRCFHHLSDCLEDTDIEEMKKIHLEEMTELLVDMVNGKVTKEELRTNCWVLHNDKVDENDEDANGDTYEEDYRDASYNPQQTENTEIDRDIEDITEKEEVTLVSEENTIKDTSEKLEEQLSLKLYENKESSSSGVVSDNLESSAGSLVRNTEILCLTVAVFTVLRMM